MNQVFELKLPDEAESLDQVAACFSRSLAEGQGLTVAVPLPSFGSSNSYLDITADLADASFVAECLGRCAQQRRFEWVRSGHLEKLHLTVSGYLPNVMANELARMSILFDYDNSEIDALRDEYESILEQCADHQELIATRDLVFPELADLYLVNLLHGAYHEWEPDAVLEELKVYPEHRYGFFVSRAVRPLGKAALSSTSEWIITGDVDFADFEIEADLNHEELLPGRMFLTNDAAIFVGNHATVRISTETLLNALACGDDYLWRNVQNQEVYEFLRFRGVPLSGATAQNESRMEACIGEFGARVLLRCQDFSVLFLDTALVSHAERTRYAALLAELEISVRDGEPCTSDISLPWSLIDDEGFEQLCYDYVFAHPDFDKDRIEKIGKSRSRDGGRDIVAWTEPDRSKTRPAVKFIFQCKHIGPTSSLSPKHITAIGDTLEQYSADGYGVMCSGYIDATLHDRIDAISVGRQLSAPRKIDRFVLERFLARRPHLVKRYFG